MAQQIERHLKQLEQLERLVPDRIYPSTIVATYGAGKIDWIAFHHFHPRLPSPGTGGQA